MPVKISDLIDALGENLEEYGDLDVRFPNHGSVRGVLGAIDGDDLARPYVIFLLEDDDLSG